MILFALALDISGTIITLQHTTEPGAIAEVVMHNHINNSPLDNSRHELTLDGLTIDLRFEWNRSGDDDAVIVTPPDGVLCIPADCVLMLPEGQGGKLILYEWLGG